MAPFITFEGGEGCGKSYQSRTLYNRFFDEKIPSLLLREPGGTALGEKIRSILKQSSDISISPVAELLLFNASRNQLVIDVIQPALVEGKVVICDRFADSSVAYQCFGRGLSRKMVQEVNATAAGGLTPDLTFLLDIPPAEGLARKRESASDRFEREELAFHERVRSGFLQLAAEEPDRWVVFDASLTRRRISEMIWEKVSPLLSPSLRSPQPPEAI